MLEIKNGYLCLNGRRYSELTQVGKVVFSINLRVLKRSKKKPPVRVVKTEV